MYSSKGCTTWMRPGSTWTTPPLPGSVPLKASPISAFSSSAPNLIVHLANGPPLAAVARVSLVRYGVGVARRRPDAHGSGSRYLSVPRAGWGRAAAAVHLGHRGRPAGE